MRFRCPHCTKLARVRNSRPLSDTSTEYQVQCLNVECAHTWIAISEAVRTIAPSMTPNPKVFIPLAPRSPAAREAAATNQLPLALDHQHPRAMASPNTS